MSRLSNRTKSTGEGWRRRRPFTLWRRRIKAVATIAVGLTATLAPGTPRAEMTIAVAAPLTGAQAAEGAAIKAAAEWALAEINVGGGIDGEKLELTIADDQCLQGRAIEAATQLAAGSRGRRPALVVGHPCAASAIAAARIYADAGVLFIATAPRHPDLTAKRAGKTIFRLAGRDDIQGMATGNFLAAAYQGRRIALVHDRTRYARGLVDQVKAGLAASGQPTPPEFGIVASEKDYSATVSALAAVKADVVYFAGFPTEAATLWTQLNGSFSAPDFVGADAIADAAVQRASVGPVLIGQTPREGGAPGKFMVVLPYTALDATGAGPLAARLSSAGLAPSASAIAAYAAIESWAAAVRDLRTTSVVIDAAGTAGRLEAKPFPTVIGSVAFDASGDARLPSFGVAYYAEGQWRTVAVVAPVNTNRTAGVGPQTRAPDTASTLRAQSPAAIKGPPLPVANPRRASLPSPVSTPKSPHPVR